MNRKLDKSNGGGILTLMNSELSAKLANFASVLEAGRLQGLVNANVDCEANRINCKVSLHTGRKYVNVDVGRSGQFMVEQSTGNIFGIKAYGQIHRGHQYGTLDTLNEWDWTQYYPTKI